MCILTLASRTYLILICNFSITVIPFVIFPLCHFPPPSKKFLEKKFVRCHFPPPKFKHIMFKNYVFCYIILIKLNKIFKIIFRKSFCWPLSFSPSQKSVKSSLFGGKMTKGITVIQYKINFSWKKILWAKY